MIKPQDVIVNYVISTGYVHRIEGVKIYHKQLDKTVQCTKHRSEHRNKQDCIEQLEALLLEPKQLSWLEQHSEDLEQLTHFMSSLKVGAPGDNTVAACIAYIERLHKQHKDLLDKLQSIHNSGDVGLALYHILEEYNNA